MQTNKLLAGGGNASSGAFIGAIGRISKSTKGVVKFKVTDRTFANTPGSKQCFNFVERSNLQKYFDRSIDLSADQKSCYAAHLQNCDNCFDTLRSDSPNANLNEFCDSVLSEELVFVN